MRFLIIYFLLLTGSLSSQTFLADSFVSGFNRADIKQKVIMCAKLSASNLHKVYPLIKDSLQSIKNKVYFSTTSNEAKYLFDIIDARIESENHQPHKAIYILENSLRFHTRTLDDSLAVLSLLSPSYIKLRNYNKAYEIEEVLERIKHRFPENFKKTFSPQKSYIFMQLGMYKESVAELRKEFYSKPAEIRKDTSSLGNFYNDMGVHFNRANFLDSAVFYFTKAKTLVDAKKAYTLNNNYWDFFSGLVDGNMASVLAKQGRYSDAIPALKKDIYFSLRAENWLSAANSYNLIAECFIELKKFDVARKYIDSCKPLLAKIDILAPKLSNILAEAKYYKKTGNLTVASQFYDHYIQFKDSIQKADNESKLINQQISFDLYQKENELVHKEKIIQQNNLDYEHEKTRKSYLLMGILILVLIIIFLIINNQLNKRWQSELFIKNKHIIQQKTAIETALKEKEFLIKEIHHRVKNNLQIISSMLSLQSDVIDNEAAKDALNESRMRINSMSLIHQMLYNKNNMSDIVISEYFGVLISEIEKSFSNSGCIITTALHCDPVTIDLDTAIPLGLIVNELITNSYKHAFKKAETGHVEISFTKVEKKFTLIAKDNGIGFDFQKVKNQSLGMELIQMLAEQLNGKLTFTNHTGTKAELEFTI